MKTWLTRVRGAIGMGVTWGIAWALGGITIGVVSNLTPFLPWHYFFDVFDAPLPALAMPGFIAGALFSIVLGIAGRGRRFAELSLPRFVVWGALAGLLAVMLPYAASLPEPASNLPWVLALAGTATLLSAASAFATLKVARIAAKQEPAEPVA